ncbi:MAG: site-specific integrase [Phycisphaerae bacterium]
MTRTRLKSWRAHYGNIAAGQIGPVLLNGWRKAELAQHSVDWVARGTTAVLALYRWAVANELVPVDTYQRLKTVEPLRHVKRKRVLPAPDAAIAAVRKLVGRQVGAMIDLQLVTGMRPGEVVVMRPCDIDMSEKVWVYRLDSHKTAYRGRERVVYLGPQAQEILRPFLRGRATTAHCFSPVEAEAEWRLERRKARKTPLSCGNRPGTNRQARPQRRPGAAYTTRTYGQAVERACQRAGAGHWSPHQLRHNYATEVRRRYGLEAARILLGHCSALVTEAVYAERDQAAAMRIAAEIG